MRDCAQTQNKTQNSFPLVQKKIRTDVSVTFCIVLLGEGVTKASIPKVFIADFGAQNGHFGKNTVIFGGEMQLHLQKFALVSSLGNKVFFF